jgi:hypothetical protein
MNYLEPINRYYQTFKIWSTQKMMVHIKNKNIDEIINTVSDILFLFAGIQCVHFSYTFVSIIFASKISKELKIVSYCLSLISIANFSNSKYKNIIDIFFQTINCLLSLIFLELFSFSINIIALFILFHKDVLLEYLQTDVKEIIETLKTSKKNDINNTAFNLGMKSLSTGIFSFIKSRKENINFIDASTNAINDLITPIHNKLKEIKTKIDTKKFREELSTFLCIVLGIITLIFYYNLIDKYVLIFWICLLVKYFNYDIFIPIEQSIINIINTYENSLLNMKNITSTIGSVISFGLHAYKIFKS